MQETFRVLIDTLAHVVPIDAGASGALEAQLVPLAVAALVKYGADPFVVDSVVDYVAAMAVVPALLASLHARCLPTVASILLQHENSVCWPARGIRWGSFFCHLVGCVIFFNKS